jgi:hypothetical protein
MTGSGARNKRCVNIKAAWVFYCCNMLGMLAPHTPNYLAIPIIQRTTHMLSLTNTLRHYVDIVVTNVPAPILARLSLASIDGQLI